MLYNTLIQQTKQLSEDIKIYYTFRGIYKKNGNSAVALFPNIILWYDLSYKLISR